MDEYFEKNNKLFCYKHKQEPFEITATLEIGKRAKGGIDKCFYENIINLFELFEFQITKKSKLEILPIIDDINFYYFIFTHEYSDQSRLLKGLKRKDIKRLRKEELNLIKNKLSKIEFPLKTLFHMDNRFSKFFKVKKLIKKNHYSNFEDYYYEFVDHLMFFGASLTVNNAINMFFDKFGYIYQKEIFSKKNAIRGILNSSKNNEASFEIPIGKKFENILKKETKLFKYFTTSKRILMYKNKCMKHIWIDGTHSLPRPYIQLINILALIKESNTYLFIGCLLTKENLNVNDWTSIFDTIKHDFNFNSVSCDNETSLVLYLNKNNITVYGDQPHYVRAISKALSNKIRKRLFTVLKFIMKFDERSELFQKLLNAATKNESVLIKKIQNQYFNNYFQGKMFEDHKIDKPCLWYAKLTTSAVEGINNRLKTSLKFSNIKNTVDRFIKISLTGAMKKRGASIFSGISKSYILECIEHPGDELFKMNSSKQNTAWAKNENKKKSTKKINNEIINFKNTNDQKTSKTIESYNQIIKEIRLAENDMTKGKKCKIKKFKKQSLSEDLNKKKIKFRKFVKSNLNILADSIITDSLEIKKEYNQSCEDEKMYGELVDMRKKMKLMEEKMNEKDSKFDKREIIIIKKDEQIIKKDEQIIQMFEKLRKNQIRISQLENGEELRNKQLRIVQLENELKKIKKE